MATKQKNSSTNAIKINQKSPKKSKKATEPKVDAENKKKEKEKGGAKVFVRCTFRGD